MKTSGEPISKTRTLASYGIGQYFATSKAGIWSNTTTKWTGRTLAHATVGGVTSELQGGKFCHGFYSSAVSTGVMHIKGVEDYMMKNDGGWHVAGRTMLAASIGGTAAELSGGKFANGAVTSAIQHLFNAEAAKAHLTKSPTDIFKHDPKGNLLFSPIRDEEGAPSIIISPDGKGKSVEGYLTTHDKIKVYALLNISGDFAYDTNCHGYSIANGRFWIQPADMTKLLNSTKLLTKVSGEPRAGDIAVYWDKAIAVHSARYVGNGNITYAAGSEIFLNGTRIDTVPKEALYRNIAPQYYRRVK